jgi:hypothetical protein
MANRRPDDQKAMTRMSAQAKPNFWTITARSAEAAVNLYFDPFRRLLAWTVSRRNAAKVSFQKAVRYLNEQFAVPSVNVRQGLLGTAMIVVVILVIRIFLPSYSTAIAEVTKLGHPESRSLAMSLVVLSALAGILIDVEQRLSAVRQSGRRLMLAVLLVCTTALWTFPVMLYFEYLERRSSGSTPAMGAIAAFLVSVSFTLLFFFAARLMIDLVGWMVLRLLVIPLFAFEMAQQLFKPGSEPVAAYRLLRLGMVAALIVLVVGVSAAFLNISGAFEIVWAALAAFGMLVVAFTRKASSKVPPHSTQDR